MLYGFGRTRGGLRPLSRNGWPAVCLEKKLNWRFPKWSRKKEIERSYTTYSSAGDKTASALVGRVFLFNRDSHHRLFNQRNNLGKIRTAKTLSYQSLIWKWKLGISNSYYTLWQQARQHLLTISTRWVKVTISYVLSTNTPRQQYSGCWFTCCLSESLARFLLKSTRRWEIDTGSGFEPDVERRVFPEPSMYEVLDEQTEAFKCVARTKAAP